MKQLLSSYSISGNVVTLTGVDRPKEAILSITDATTGAILYTAQTGGASAYSKNDAGSGNSKITLTTTPGASDRLQIFYDDGVAPANAPTSVSVSNFPSSTEISNDVGNPIPVSASSLPLPTGAAQDGTDGTGITAPTGGSGIRGWLSGIYSKLSNALAVTQSGTWSIGRTWTLGSGTDSVTVQGGNSTAVKVDGTAAIQLGSGVVTATTQRVTLATDGPEVTNSTAIKNNTANIPAKGAATTANSTPVNIASDQVVPMSISDGQDQATGSKADAAWTTGSGSVIAILKAIAGLFTSGNQTTKIVNGANTLAVDSSGALTANTPASIAYSFSSTAQLGTGVLTLTGPSGSVSVIDCTNIRSLLISLPAYATGLAMQAQISNDNSSWTASPVYGTTATGGLYTSLGTGTSGTGTFYCNTFGAKYFRLNVTFGATAAGTTTINIQALQAPYTPVQTLVSIASNQTVQTNVVASANQGFIGYHNNLSAASVNATNVKASSGSIGSLILSNTSASWRWLLFVNKASAPVSGTDSPVLAIGIPPNSTLDCSSSYAGLRLNAGISYYISASNTFTGTSTSSTPTAVGAGEVNVCMTYV